MEAGEAIIAIYGLLMIAVMGIAALGSFICLILVWIKMFEHDETGIGIAAVLLTVLCCCGLGPLLTYIFGWVRCEEWGIKKLMLWWTACIVGGFCLWMLSSMAMFVLDAAGVIDME